MRDLRELNLEWLESSPQPTFDPRLVTKLEAELGRGLPREYVEVLAYCNGGSPDLDTYLPPGHPEEERCDLRSFFSLSPDRSRRGGVFWALAHFSKLLRSGQLPIGEDNFGNFYAIDLTQVLAPVELWSHDPTVGFTRVADSFSAFVDGLEKNPRLASLEP